MVKKELSQQKIRRYVEAFQGPDENSHSEKQSVNSLRLEPTAKAGLPKVLVTEADAYEAPQTSQEALRIPQTQSGSLHEDTERTKAHLGIPHLSMEPQRPGLHSLGHEVPVVRRARGRGWRLLKSMSMQQLHLQTSQSIDCDEEEKIHHV